MMLAPILLFVYNRPAHAKRAIEALLHNTLAAESELFIYSDAARSPEDCKSVNEVRSFIHSVNGFKKVHIIEREKNYGWHEVLLTELPHKSMHTDAPLYWKMIW